MGLLPKINLKDSYRLAVIVRLSICHVGLRLSAAGLFLSSVSAIHGGKSTKHELYNSKTIKEVDTVANSSDNNGRFKRTQFTLICVQL